MIFPYAGGGLFYQYKMMQKTLKMTETLANWYSSESTQQELSNEYQHDRVTMVFKNLCVLELRTKVASALKVLTIDIGNLLFSSIFILFSRNVHLVETAE